MLANSFDSLAESDSLMLIGLLPSYLCRNVKLYAVVVITNIMMTDEPVTKIGDIHTRFKPIFMPILETKKGAYPDAGEENQTWREHFFSWALAALRIEFRPW